jgi:hypothetical protein
MTKKNTLPANIIVTCVFFIASSNGSAIIALSSFGVTEYRYFFNRQKEPETRSFVPR